MVRTAERTHPDAPDYMSKKNTKTSPFRIKYADTANRIAY